MTPAERDLLLEFDRDMGAVPRGSDVNKSITALKNVRRKWHPDPKKVGVLNGEFGEWMTRIVVRHRDRIMRGTILEPLVIEVDEIERGAPRVADAITPGANAGTGGSKPEAPASASSADANSGNDPAEEREASAAPAVPKKQKPRAAKSVAARHRGKKAAKRK